MTTKFYGAINSKKELRGSFVKNGISIVIEEMINSLSENEKKALIKRINKNITLHKKFGYCVQVITTLFSVR